MFEQLRVDNKINSVCIKGHCTHETVEDLSNKAKSSTTVVAIGGGTIMDIAKALAAKLNKKVITIPSSKSYANRYLILAAINKSKIEIQNLMIEYNISHASGSGVNVENIGGDVKFYF